MSVAPALRESVDFTFVEGPKFTLNPTGQAPLAGIIEFKTDKPCCADVTVSDGDRLWFIPTSDEAQTDHKYIILGMRAGRNHTLHVTVNDAQGNRLAHGEPIRFETAELPDDIPAIEVRYLEAARMEPGVTVFGVRKSARMGAKYYGYLVAVDTHGEIVWYRETGHTVGDIKRLRNGNIIYLSFDNRAVEYNMLGEVVTEWYAAARWPDLKTETDTAIPVDAEAFHHEIFELENGNFLVVSVETRDLPNYPVSEDIENTETETVEVVSDVIVEFARDGSVVNRWSLFDILDPYRLGYGSLNGYWGMKGIPGSRDWSHTNAVVYDPSDDTIVISVRHQDAVIKFSRATGELVWILGNHENWKEPWAKHLLEPVGDLQWQYHQHNSKITDRGTILLFDNGNFRASPGQEKVPAAENYSRVVEYKVNANAQSVEQVWSYGGPGDEAYYSAFICGAQVLPETGNILANFGGVLTDDNGEPSDNPTVDLGHVRIVEVEYETQDKVWELFIDERDQGKGWDVYRVERFSSLYA